ncbi:MAG TPA: hypothetical protein VLJ68_02565 [Chitinophagaceae bacterium]|nr:hypothetical protein [Chitinophagaceae bacterium]
MTDHPIICPYTGLRSFTEEESLYFKGRDLQVDQITALLEQNKFLMVTGASGEGKSSLIYAGLIPNARAGFFKAKYTNWIVADFRPERSPVTNMAEALAETFETKASTIETELRRGFSSLVDLYTNSDFYIDENEEQWKKLKGEEQQERKRKAANLMIIVDQFEEFFTNPENFYNEAPSQDSQVVVNLVLETARIAIKKNLPVYVVCTMRSDYIGQCSAFRGLPEYIGFSQFFVPRLKRKDLKQVIEEPAILSGNRISQRLIERLVFDIADGIDQLPILQHALSQVWLAANRGQEEMDLLHYAMVGGMPADELPDEDRSRFNNWLKALPPVQQKYYKQTGLNKIIEIHASGLYENARETYNKRNPQQQLSQQEVKRIIALTFSCLTKIDHSRAVRNRMSLDEITGIINSPGISPAVVGEVLEVYREEGNSFIRPFITEDPATKKLKPDTVLDITHESLIRNWNKLNDWANREFEYYSTYLDFKKQLGRWKSSRKKNGFLLPIGPLTYFENWYNKCKPNAGWIKRYSEIEEDPVKANKDAEEILGDVREFLKRSAGKVAVTRAFMKYGPRRIATLAAIVCMLVFTGFYWYNAEKKQNGSVIRKIRKETAVLLKSKEIGFDVKAVPLLIENRYEPGYAMNFIGGLATKEKLSLALQTYQKVLTLDKYDTTALKTELRSTAGATLQELITKDPDYSFLVSHLNEFSTLLAYDHYYNPSPQTEQMLRDIADRGYEITKIFLSRKDLYKSTISPELNYCIEQWLTFGQAGPEKLQALLTLFSPFEEGGKRDIFDTYYPKGTYETDGNGKAECNGGYQVLASLYAATGNTDKLLHCYDAIYQNDEKDYFTWERFNNHTRNLAILYQFGHRDKKDAILQWLSKKGPESALDIYTDVITQAGYISHQFLINIFRGGDGYMHPNLCFSKREVFNALCEDYEILANRVNNSSERNYLLAIQYKRKAIYSHKNQYDRRMPLDTAYQNKWLKEAVDHFRLVDKAYLNGQETLILNYYNNGLRKKTFTRRQVFVYPDYMGGWSSLIYHSDLFFKYMEKNNLFEEFYLTPEDIAMLNFWIAKAYEETPFASNALFENNYPLGDEVFVKLLSLVQTHSQGKHIDPNLFCLILANRSFARKDTTAGLNYYHQFDKDHFAVSRDRYEYLEKTFFLNQLKGLCANLALAGKQKEAVELAEKFEKENEKAFVYILMAEKLFREKTDPLAFDYLDSVFSKSKEIDFSQFSFDTRQDPRFNWILLLSRIGGRKLNILSDELATEILQANKIRAITRRIYGMAEEGNYFRAQSAIPSTLTETQDLFTRSTIIWQACRKKESDVERSRGAPMDYYITHDDNYVFFVTNL